MTYPPLSPPPQLTQVKANIAQKDEDLELLRDAVQTEKVKIARLEKLLKSNTSSNASVGGGSSASSASSSVKK